MRGAALAKALQDAREYTLRLYAHLAPGQRRVPLLDVINPPAWEMGHVAWFQEFWCRRYRPDDPQGAQVRPVLPQADAWFDSRHVAHATRWTLPLPAWAELHDYLAVTLAATLDAVDAAPPWRLDLVELALLHEDMHGEAMLMTLHTLALPAPPGLADPGATAGPPADGDVEVGGGRIRIGSPASDDGRLAFDNERCAHEVTIAPFAIAAAPVTAGAFAAFVDDGGYGDARWWTGEGRRWREGAARDHPHDWRRSVRVDGWEERRFDRWRPLVADAPMRHVNAFEAEAFCRWAGRRLPDEAEWECAARVGAVPLNAGVWEWTASPFLPYPGFVPGAYGEYSAPWFGDHRVLRGGSWATRERLAAPAFRNFYRPHRHDAFAGFRTCAARRDG
ncbi:MAG TPA: selenoneine synthase SenA [Casimicrobiaceae bacterium]|nr:selenoneine synthase SenA [Casimicrobiaceae bacterium]